jgi:hypothetical protein
VLNTELECLKRELSDKSNDLNNEREKADSLIRSEQCLKLKYEAALESIDKLTVEFDDIKLKLVQTEKDKKTEKSDADKLADEMRFKNVRFFTYFFLF